MKLVLCGKCSIGDQHVSTHALSTKTTSVDVRQSVGELVGSKLFCVAPLLEARIGIEWGPGFAVEASVEVCGHLCIHSGAEAEELQRLKLQLHSSRPSRSNRP